MRHVVYNGCTMLHSQCFQQVINLFSGVQNGSYYGYQKALLSYPLHSGLFYNNTSSP